MYIDHQYMQDCRNCKSLCTYTVYFHSCSDMEKMYLYRLNILGDIVKMLEMFKFDPGVTSEVFGVITCLSNVTTFVEALSSKAVHKQVGACISGWSFVTMVPLSSCTRVYFQNSWKRITNMANSTNTKQECFRTYTYLNPYLHLSVCVCREVTAYSDVLGPRYCRHSESTAVTQYLWRVGWR